jgi:hypothetical protein
MSSDTGIGGFVSRMFSRSDIRVTFPMWSLDISESRAGDCFTAKPKQQGQGVLEFIVVSSSILFFIFLFINLCYVFLVTQYIDYAVYMSARALYASHGEPKAQAEMAKRMLNRMLRLEQGGAFGPLVRFKTSADRAVMARAVYPNPKTGKNEVVGVRLEYEVPVFMIPPMGILRQEDLRGISRMTLISETYLDREPTQEECYQFFEAYVNRYFSYLPQNARAVMISEASDDGC